MQKSLMYMWLHQAHSFFTGTFLANACLMLNTLEILGQPPWYWQVITKAYLFLSKYAMSSLEFKAGAHGANAAFLHKLTSNELINVRLKNILRAKLLSIIF